MAKAGDSVSGFSSNVRRTLSVEGLIQRMDNTGPNNAPLYIGLATPGTATSAAGWQIKKLSYDGNDITESVLFADGDTNFDNKWSERASLSYS